MLSVLLVLARFFRKIKKFFPPQRAGLSKKFRVSKQSPAKLDNVGIYGKSIFGQNT